RDTDRPVIRSTCPSIVSFVEKYRPQMVKNLAPIASPMMVQGRIVKLLYGNVAVVFIGPCIAKQAEMERDHRDTIDQVLTFDQLINMFKEVDIDLDNYPAEDDDRPVVGRVFSTPGGFPVDILNDSSEKARLMISRSLGSAKQALSKPQVEADESRFLDLLSCHGCIDGPAFGAGNRRSRLAEIGHKATKSPITMDFTELTPLPDVEMTQVFTACPSEKKVGGHEDLEEELSSVGLSDPSRKLNCSLCGYTTCTGHAGAVIMGLSDWSACLPNQRRLLQEKASRLKEATYTDALTGLVNHRGFVDALGAEHHRYIRYKTELSVIMSDVDSFKQINDVHGHLQGDKVLKLLAQILVQNLRETDIAARYGGDEFAIILPEISQEEAVIVAEKLRAKVSDTVFWLGEDIRERVSLSLGICSATERDTDPAMFLNRADKALYKAKRAGRNRTVIAE
ncbi:MAG TPA: diguanylate cyclase, partial [Actinobacteria bacterium]|nr:diguanylate cyclase [Actinomycetota bacterium]